MNIRRFCNLVVARIISKKKSSFLIDLPNEIICHIGSFLSAKEAAFIMVLSKKWRNLFTIIPKLHFDGLVDDDDDDERLEDFLDGVLDLPVNTRIRTFSLKCNHVAQYDDQIKRCLCEVVKLGVMVLELQMKVAKEGSYSLPLEIFTCKTVHKMELGSGFAIDGLPADALLPALKTLSLDSVFFCNDFGGGCAFQALVSASPVLEELVMDGIEWESWKWSCVVSSPILERLTIRRQVWDSYERYGDDSNVLDSRGLAYDFDSISFDTPRLTYLEYSDYVPKEYRVVNLNSLVEAKLDLRVDEGSVWGDEHAEYFDPMNLINGLKDVEILDLNFETMEMLYGFCEALPVFGKLLQVSISLSNFCWFSLPALIQKSPNLKTLIIEDSLHCGYEEELVCHCMSETSDVLSSSLEVLKITRYEGTMEELEQMKHFLGKLACLLLVEVHAQVSGGDGKLRVMEDLLILPRVSSKCKIQVKFS